MIGEVGELGQGVLEDLRRINECVEETDQGVMDRKLRSLCGRKGGGVCACVCVCRVKALGDQKGGEDNGMRTDWCNLDTRSFTAQRITTSVAPNLHRQ